MNAPKAQEHPMSWFRSLRGRRPRLLDDGRGGLGGGRGGDNNIWWLAKHAYGSRDEKCFRLKIFDLLNIKIKQER